MSAFPGLRLLCGALLGGILALAPTAASAHRLKLFVTVDGGDVVGEAFFVGGGRPEGVAVVARDPGGAEVGRTLTSETGEFRLHPARVGDLVVAVDTGDGHFAEARLVAERFGAASTGTVSAGAAEAPRAVAAEPAIPTDQAATARIEAAVHRALARQIRPLLEATEKAEARLRFNDVVGGLGMIVGLVGTALWVSSRRRSRPGEGDGR